MKNKIKYKTIAVATGILIACILLVTVESISYFILVSLEQPTQPFLFDRHRKSLPPAQVWDEKSQTLTYIDPHLAFAHNPDLFGEKKYIPGFLIHPSRKAGQIHPLRIIALGGSTTAPSEHDWPFELHKALASRGVHAEVFNGGVPGYSSGQELLKLVRDVIGLKPDIVISLSGVNDLGFIHSLPKHPLIHPYQKKVLGYLVDSRSARILPNTVFLVKRTFRGKRWRITGINYGPEIKMTPAANWLKNSRIMAVLAREFGFHYLSILQPVLGYGAFKPNAEEQRMLEEIKKRNGYYRSLITFYTEAKKTVKSYPFSIDYSDLFSNDSGVYKDPRHQNEKGVRILAISILSELTKRGWLNNDSSLKPD